LVFGLDFNARMLESGSSWWEKWDLFEIMDFED